MGVFKENYAENSARGAFVGYPALRWPISKAQTLKGYAWTLSFISNPRGEIYTQGHRERQEDSSIFDPRPSPMPRLLFPAYYAKLTRRPGKVNVGYALWSLYTAG